MTWEQIQQRDGRWAIIDLVGKRNRVRSVGLPPWVKVALDRWAAAVGVYGGNVFRALNKDGGLAGRVQTKGGGVTDGNLIKRVRPRKTKMLVRNMIRTLLVDSAF